ncbi:MAG TPA: MBL fold metallo-hydrolase [Gammaproteobacteria bacterium]|nr:MBL fold metallo-hydrolase [Gammaproteobacteria bacterium]
MSGTSGRGRIAMRRRDVLKGAAAGFGALAVGPLARVALAADAPAVERVTDRLALVTGAGGNVLVLAADDGQVVVDSGAAASSTALLAALGSLPGGGRVQRLFNTHWHPEQVGANEALGKAGAKIIAHAKTRAHLAAGYYLPAEDRYVNPLPAPALPTEVVYTHGETTAGGERIEYGYLLEAHTDGDLYVYFRGSNVVAVGGAISPERDPVLDWFGGGWLGGRVDALEQLLAMTDEKTRFVPSDGPVVGRAAVEAERDFMRTVFDRMVELVRKGDSPEDCLAAGALDGLSRKLADPLAFIYSVHKGLWAHHNTLSPDIV